MSFKNKGKIKMFLDTQRRKNVLSDGFPYKKC